MKVKAYADITAIARVRRELQTGEVRAKLQGLSQQEIANAIGCTQASVCHWLMGTRRPGAEFALRLARLLDALSGEPLVSRDR